MPGDVDIPGMQKGAFYGLITLLVVAAIAGVYFYTQQPARAVTNAVQKLGTAETQQFTATVDLGTSTATQQLLGEPANVTIKLTGSFDRRGEERDSLISDIDITASTESVTVKITGEVRFIDDQAFIFVAKAPAVIPILSKLKGQWVALPRGGSAEVSDIEIDGPLFTKVSRDGREKVTGKSTVKYETVATEHALISILSHIAQLLGSSLTSEQINNMSANLQNIEQLPISLWITPWGHDLVQLELILGSPDGEQITYTLAFTERNKSVDHQIPAETITIEEALK